MEKAQGCRLERFFQKFDAFTSDIDYKGNVKIEWVNLTAIIQFSHLKNTMGKKNLLNFQGESLESTEC